VSATSTLDNRGLIWYFVKITGSRGNAIFRGCVDTGACFTVFNEHSCLNLGIPRKGNQRIQLMTVKGDTTARIYTIPQITIVGTQLKASNVDVVAKNVRGFPLILGMNFLRNFNWKYDKETTEFTLSNTN
jgi:clan AA aspartic protease (TIGR02281 family)